MKNGFTLIELLVTIALISLALAILVGISEVIATNKMHKKAVELGIAEYVIVDSASGKTDFKWKSSVTNINVPKPWLETTVTNNDETYTINIYKK